MLFYCLKIFYKPYFQIEIILYSNNYYVFQYNTYLTIISHINSEFFRNRFNLRCFPWRTLVCSLVQIIFFQFLIKFTFFKRHYIAMKLYLYITTILNYSF